jgi:hypothetical protein
LKKKKKGNYQKNEGQRAHTHNDRTTTKTAPQKKKEEEEGM